MHSRHYFGTDGVRGLVGRSPMTPDFLVRLGFAAGRVLIADKTRKVIISKDTRRSGYMVESALQAGLAAAGVDVLLTGPLPTSAVSYLTHALRLSAGIVISASHNPYHDNGVKFFAADGTKLPDSMEKEIEQLLESTDNLDFHGTPGRAERLEGAGTRYIEFCKRAYPSTLDLQGIRVVVDCANGAAYKVAPAVLYELKADVVSIGDRPDGTNINVECGALAPAAAIEKVQQVRADIGLVLDGDADRILLIDELGCLHDGDALLYLIAKNKLLHGERPAGIVGTVLSSLTLERQLAAMGVDFYRAGVGDRYVNEAMVERRWQVGGEPAGHILLHHFHRTGDGIIAGLQVLRAMQESAQPLSVLLKDFQRLPQVKRDIRIPNHLQVMSQLSKAIDDCRQAYGEAVRLVVRPSGTESMIRIMAEGEDSALLRASVNRIEALIMEIRAK